MRANRDVPRELPHGFPRQLRLRRSADFARLAQDRSGPHFTRSWLSLSARPRSADEALPLLRIGFTASRRQAPRAVARNMVKRVLREAARHSAAAAAAGSGMDVVLRLRSPLPGAGERGWGAVKRELRVQADWLLQKLAGPAP
jgi:ribonuclease P protein component